MEALEKERERGGVMVDTSQSNNSVVKRDQQQVRETYTYGYRNENDKRYIRKIYSGRTDQSWIKDIRKRQEVNESAPALTLES